MNATLTYLLGQVVTLGGLSIMAYIFGHAFAKGVSKEIKILFKELKKDMPLWIHSYVKESREARVVSEAIESRKKY